MSTHSEHSEHSENPKNAAAAPALVSLPVSGAIPFSSLLRLLTPLSTLVAPSFSVSSWLSARIPTATLPTSTPTTTPPTTLLRPTPVPSRPAAALIAVLVPVLLAAPATSLAAELSFGEVWRRVESGSHARRAASAKAEAQGVAASRASRHWLPRIWLGAHATRTDEAGQNLFALLGQRSVTAADFAPEAMNRPGSQTFTRGALGLDLPLYEGGGSSALAEGADHLRAASEAEADEVLVRQFTESAQSYAALITLGNEGRELRDLRQSVAGVIGRYQLGSRSNPVGYSGLLGLRTLANRLEGLLSENASRVAAHRAALREMGVEESGWTPVPQSVTEFSSAWLPPAATAAHATPPVDVPEAGAATNHASPDESPSLRSEWARAAAARSRIAAERSRFLPRLGLFAERSLTHGKRSTERSTAVGAYLTWSLFHPVELGAVGEARLQAAAAESFALAAAARERAEHESLEAGAAALRKNLALMEESLRLLTEQTKTAEALFRNGSINALQLVEALSRRADLITSAAEASLALMRAEGERARRENFTVPRQGSAP